MLLALAFIAGCESTTPGGDAASESPDAGGVAQPEPAPAEPVASGDTTPAPEEADVKADPEPAEPDGDAGEVSEPAADPAPDVTMEPTAEPDGDASPAPDADAAPEPGPESDAETDTDAAPEADPAPEPDPAPAPEPDPTPEPAPEPQPSPSPEPVPQPDPEPAPSEDACLGEADLAILDTVDVQKAASDCIFGCFQSPDIEGCVAACVAGKTGLTTACAGCFGATVTCAMENCIAQCISDPEGAPCQECTAEKCTPAFEVCSGIVAEPEPEPTPSPSAEPNPEPAPEPVPEPDVPGGACTNDEDLPIVTTVKIESVAESCMMGCFGGNMQKCLTDCVSEKTGLSTPCASCYGDLMVCVLSKCNVCLQNPSSPACSDCSEEKCVPGLLACTGLEEGGPQDPEPEGQPEGPPAVDGCKNPADQAEFAEGGVAELTFQCAGQCQSYPGPMAECMDQCVASQSGLSEDCGSCLGYFAECGVTSCPACDDEGITSNPCHECSVNACGDDFMECAGIPFPPPEPGGGDGACTNPDDGPILASEPVGEISGKCALGCIGKPFECTQECVESDAILSPDCANCFANYQICAIEECLDDCNEDPKGGLCLGCLHDSCEVPFEDCSGLSDYDLGPPPQTTVGACQAPVDQEVLASQDVDAIAFGCALEDCFGSGDPLYCNTACVRNQTGLSDPCAGCYGIYYTCWMDNCYAICKDDWAAGPCTSCIDATCQADFDTCVGPAP